MVTRGMGRERARTPIKASGTPARTKACLHSSTVSNPSLSSTNVPFLNRDEINGHVIVLQPEEAGAVSAAGEEFPQPM